MSKLVSFLNLAIFIVRRNNQEIVKKSDFFTQIVKMSSSEINLNIEKGKRTAAYAAIDENVTKVY
jgi:hypothetical protein